jgi:hypothetical protein
VVPNPEYSFLKWTQLVKVGVLPYVGNKLFPRNRYPYIKDMYTFFVVGALLFRKVRFVIWPLDRK